MMILMIIQSTFGSLEECCTISLEMIWDPLSTLCFFNNSIRSSSSGLEHAVRIMALGLVSY